MRFLSQGFFFTCLCILTVVALPSSARCEDFPSQLEKPLDKSISIRRQTQKAQDNWEVLQRKLTAEYERLAAERDRLAHRRDTLSQTAESLRSSVSSLEHQLGEVSRIHGELAPYLEQTFRHLADFIASDTPFLMDERTHRLKLVRQILDDPQVAIGEKYRKLMEALFVEAEYGNTVEIYREKIDLDGTRLLVDIFRLGRVSLFFRTLDGKTVGIWSPAQKSWAPLPEEHNRAIHEAMEMAAKRRSVDVVSLPLGRMTVP